MNTIFTENSPAPDVVDPKEPDFAQQCEVVLEQCEAVLKAAAESLAKSRSAMACTRS